MNTLPDAPQPAMGALHTDVALLQAVANMRPGWIVLRDCRLARGDWSTRARVRYALLHPEIGVALLDIVPGTTTRGAPDCLRRLLDAADFRFAFGTYPPIVYLCVPSRTLSSLGLLLAGEFNLLPPLALAGGGAWVGAAQRALTGEPPLEQPGQAALGGQPLPAGAPGPARTEDRFEWKPGLRGLAAFWGVVTLTFGGGALVLQHLGPPEEPSAAVHAGGGPGEPRAPQAPSEAWPTPAYPDQARLPSPGPVLALWPAERMPTPFDPARAGTTVRETGDLAGIGLRPADDRLTPMRGAFPNVSQRQPVDGGTASSAEMAGTASAPAGTREVPISVSRTPVPDAPAQVDRSGAAGDVLRQALVAGGAGAPPSVNRPRFAASGTLATAPDSPHGFAGGTRDAPKPAGGPDAPAAALLGAPLPRCGR